ncbi:nucleotidyltransferase family protein [Peribacillus frigoritolerans]|uniref:nucleotidyltransferase domain-containing protein n=1 Tax=Peribacillus frigoritolerans TaxID=450367 RepID=UPI003D27B6D2
MDNNNGLELSMIPKELRLLLEIITMENEESIGSFKDDLDWELFLKLAKHHRVYPLIYSKLIKINENLVPRHVFQILHQEYKKNLFQMLHLSGEMEQVSKLFTENQIRLLFLKGPVIASEIYGDISLRTSKDLDILIPLSDVKRAGELLMKNGYEREEIPKFDNWRNHDVSYFHPQKRIEIELHSRLHAYPMNVPSFNELWERKRISKLTSYPVHFLGHEDLFLYLVSHGAKHGWFRLRWLVDIDQIIRKRVVSQKNNFLLLKYQHQHLGKQANLLRGQALLLVSELLKTPICNELRLLTEEKRSKKFAQLALSYIIGMGDFRQSKDDLSKCRNNSPFSIKSNFQKWFLMNHYQFLIKSNLHKFIFILQLFYPSSVDEKTLRLPKSLRFLYFPLRPFLWAWRMTRKTI